MLETTPTDPVLRKEHFGFRDGITNPRARQPREAERAADVIADGEVLLGYKNSYGHFPMSPEVPAGTDRRGRSWPRQDRPARKDFGENGSYLVFRQLAQDVRAFWRYVYEAKDAIPGVPAGARGPSGWASRLVGRWPNGTPVTRYPEQPGPRCAATT